MNEKITVTAVVFLALWSSFLTYQFFGSGQVEMPESLRKGEKAVVAFIHGDSIQANWEFIADREKAMFIAVQQAQLSMERKSRPLQEEAQELIEYANGPKATNDEVMMAQNRLVEIENALGQMQSQQQTELMQMESTIQSEISVKLSSEVAAFAHESELDMVLNWGRSGEGVLFGQTGFDVTVPLLEFMNDRYETVPDTTPLENKP
jgi:hypothetical protein